MEKRLQDEMILTLIMAVVAALGGCLIGEAKMPYNVVSIPQKELTYNTLVNNCRNESMKISADCIMSYLSSCKTYRVVNDSINLTFEELTNNGGDCRDWTHLMIQIGNDYNFTTNKIVFYGRNDTNHVIGQWSTCKGYCLFDIYSYMCITYEN